MVVAAPFVASCEGLGQRQSAAPQTLPPGNVELWDLAAQDLIEPLIKRFETRYPSVKVNRVGGVNLDKIQVAVAGGTPPDVAGAIGGWIPTIASKGLAESLTDAMKGIKEWDPDGIPAGFRLAHSHRGKMYAHPYITDSTPVGINLDLLERAGLKVPADSWGWDTLADYASRLTIRQGADTVQWGYIAPRQADDFATAMYTVTLASFGGSWLDSALEKATFHKAEGQGALDWYVDLVRRRRASPFPWPADWETSRQFANPIVEGFLRGASGGAAVFPCQTFQTRALKTYGQGMRFQIVLPPRKVKMASHQSGGAWYLVKGAPHHQHAIEFMRHLISPEELAIWAATSVRLPPHRAAIAHPTYQELMKTIPELKIHWDTAQGAVTYPPVVGWTDCQPVVAKAIIDALQGNVTPQAALEDAARQVDAILARARSA
jgi:multiple sugar transport system substrate-binding protein